MNDYYEKIMMLDGADDLKLIIKKWDQLSHNMPASFSDSTVLLPDLLWFGHHGQNMTRIVRMTSEYLFSTKKLMEFYGDVKYFQFRLEYCAPHKPFSEIQYFVDAMDNAAGFRSLYKGVVFIDVEPWRKHFKERYFIDFLRYLSDNSDPWLIIISINDLDDYEKQELQSMTSLFLRVETVQFTAPSIERLSEYASSYLNDNGVLLTNAAKQLISKSISLLSETQYFEGYGSVKRFCNDILYSLLIKNADLSEKIGKKYLEEFDENSDYIRVRTINKKQSRKIGLTIGE